MFLLPQQVDILTFAESLTRVKLSGVKLSEFLKIEVILTLEKIRSIIVVRGSREDSAGMLEAVGGVFFTMNSFLSEVF